MLNKLRIIFFFLFCVSPLSFADNDESGQCKSQGEFICCLDRTTNSPFFITHEYLQGKKQYENFRDLDKKLAKQYAPLGTIVYSPPELYKLDSTENYRSPYRVMSVPNKKLEKTSKPKNTERKMLEDFFEGVGKKTRVKEGDVGYINKKSLRSIDQYTFYVKENSPVYSTPKGNLLNGKKLVPAKDDDGFIISKCCIETPSKEVKCTDFHYFQVLDMENKLIESVSIFSLGCGVLENITAIPEKDSSPIQEIVNLLKESAETSAVYDEVGAESLELIYETNTLKRKNLETKAKIKLLKLPMDDKTLHGPCNTRHYTADDWGDTDGYISPYAGCNFLKLACEYQKECSGKGCQIQWGNAFHKRKCKKDKKNNIDECRDWNEEKENLLEKKKQLGSKFSSKDFKRLVKLESFDLEEEWGKHKSHSTGECIDIRPFRTEKDDILTGETWHAKIKKDGKLIKDKSRKNKWYDRERTKKFMEMAIKAGATDVFFNDPILKKHFSDPDVKKDLLPNAKPKYYWDDWWKIGGREKTGHDDHIHLCFRSENPRAKKYCDAGL